jgi:hypothetical protein
VTEHEGHIPAPDADPVEPSAQVEQSAPPAESEVAAALRRLDQLGDLPPAEHVEVYESVHRSLQESLAQAADPGEDRDPPRSAPS